MIISRFYLFRCHFISITVHTQQNIGHNRIIGKIFRFKVCSYQHNTVNYLPSLWQTNTCCNKQPTHTISYIRLNQTQNISNTYCKTSHKTNYVMTIIGVIILLYNYIIVMYKLGVLIAITIVFVLSSYCLKYIVINVIRSTKKLPLYLWGQQINSFKHLNWEALYKQYLDSHLDSLAC